MLRPVLLLTLSLPLVLAACTAQEKQVVQELENLPGITCTTSAKGSTTCGPDSLSDTANPQ